MAVEHEGTISSNIIVIENDRVHYDLYKCFQHFYLSKLHRYIIHLNPCVVVCPCIDVTSWKWKQVFLFLLYDTNATHFPFSRGGSAHNQQTNKRKKDPLILEGWQWAVGCIIYCPSSLAYSMHHPYLSYDQLWTWARSTLGFVHKEWTVIYDLLCLPSTFSAHTQYQCPRTTVWWCLSSPSPLHDFGFGVAGLRL